MEKMDLLLRTAFFPDAIELDDDNPDQYEIGDPVAKFFEALDLQKLGVPTFGSDWNDPVGVIAKREASESLPRAVRDEAVRDQLIAEGATELHKAWQRR